MDTIKQTCKYSILSIENLNKKIGVHDALLAIPPLNRLQRQLEQNSCQLSDQQLNLLSWVFNGGQSQLSLRTMTKVEGIETLRRVGVKPGAQISLPTHAFEVKTISTDRLVFKGNAILKARLHLKNDTFDSLS